MNSRYRRGVTGSFAFPTRPVRPESLRKWVARPWSVSCRSPMIPSVGNNGREGQDRGAPNRCAPRHTVDRVADVRGFTCVGRVVQRPRACLDRAGIARGGDRPEPARGRACGFRHSLRRGGCCLVGVLRGGRRRPGGRVGAAVEAAVARRAPGVTSRTASRRRIERRSGSGRFRLQSCTRHAFAAGPARASLPMYRPH